jgi:hypothetical protein
MSNPATIKVKPWGDGQGSHVVINEEDFDEAVHKKLSAAELAKIEKAEASDESEEAE